MGKYKFLTVILPVSIFLLILTIIGYAKEPYEYLVEFCRLGERAPGTEGHISARNYIMNNLDGATIDSFNVRGHRLYNISKKFTGKKPIIIGIGAHWDSEPGSVGANDGGSGVALLLKLADTLKITKPEIGIELVFFDGEDVDDAALLGSSHYAMACIEDFSFFLVIDMVGDKNLGIFKEGNSYRFFPQLVDSIWEIGGEAAPGLFLPSVKYYIKDDHMALIKYGIRAIDIIDFDYPYWHTRDDTIDKCSRESLNAMYAFLVKIIYPSY